MSLDVPDPARAVLPAPPWPSGWYPGCAAHPCVDPALYWIVYRVAAGVPARSRRCRYHAQDYAARHALAMPVIAR